MATNLTRTAWIAAVRSAATETSAMCVLDNVFSEIWPSFIQPLMELDLQGKNTDSAQDGQERLCYEREISKDANLMDTLRNAYLLQQQAKALKDETKVYESEYLFFFFFKIITLTH